MAFKTFEDSKTIGENKIVYGYVSDDKVPNSKKLVYEINKDKRTIIFRPYSDYYFFDSITINGYIDLPEIFQKKGFTKNSVFDYINRVFKDKGIKTITVNRTGKCSLIKRGRDKHLHLSYRSISTLCDEIGSMNYLHRNKRSKFVLKHLHSEFPSFIKVKETKASQDEIKNAIQSLKSQTPDSFNNEEIDKLTDFLSNLMKEGHRSQISKSKLFKNTKLKFDTVTLTEVIDSFEVNLQKSRSEAIWGKFLQANLFLIDSKYIYSLDQLNLVLGGTRRVDFGLVDIHGYLDIFEIKKPETKLLSERKDSRGNYSWSKDAIEAIVQAEKYLYHAERKGANLKEDIKREREIDLEVIRPRAYVIMGNTHQLDNSSKKEDFRILKNQFKNIEIILYDELLERIKNQKKSIE